MDDLNLINNTSVYRNPAASSPLQGPNVMQPAVVYSKIMLRTIELAESDFEFDKLAQERTMPSNNGANEILFKRMLSLAAHTQPLVEGIPPASDQGRMVAIKGTTKQYGRVMKFTDKVNWAVVDPLISEYTRQLSLKIPETKDILAQEALLAEAQVFYACRKKNIDEDHDYYYPIAGGEVTHIERLTPECTPTIDEFRKIVLSMEACKVRPLRGTNFLCLVSPAVMFDLITDKRVKEFMHYANTGESYKNNVTIDLFNLEFRKAKTIKTDNSYVDADGVVRFIYHDSDANVNLILPKAFSEMEASDTYDVVNLINGAKTTKVANTGDTAIATKYKAFDVLNIHHSFILGEECLFRIGVEGHTAPQFIKKELGSAGTEDPLNQRQSIGWKIDSLGYKVANPDAVVDYMSIPSQYRINVNARPDVKNQFTDYFYGYVDAEGKYYHPEQVVETLSWDGSKNVMKYVVRGIGTEVTPVKMTKLVKAINGGRIFEDGKKAVVKGDVPTMQFYLVSDAKVRFAANQIEKHTDGKYYIKGLAGTASAEVKAIEPDGVTFGTTVAKGDGTGYEERTAIVEHGDVNLTGDARIDDIE